MIIFIYRLITNDLGRDSYDDISNKPKDDELQRCFSVEQCENFDMGNKEGTYITSPSLIKDSIMSYSKNSQSIITHLLGNEQEIVPNEISFGIERSYQKMLKQKQRTSSFDKSKYVTFTQETFFFTLEGYNDQMEISDYNSDNEKKTLYMNNQTEPNYIKTKKNLLEDYLPKIKGSNIYNNKSNEPQDVTNSPENDIDMLHGKYYAIKNDMIELNPTLKANPSYREQFFINLSEGKEERYLFFKNLYNIINEHPQKNKQVFQPKKLQMKYFKNTNKLQPITNGNSTKAPLPTLHAKLYKEMANKRKLNRISAPNESNMAMPSILGKSASGCNLNTKYKTSPLFS